MKKRLFMLSMFFMVLLLAFGFVSCNKKTDADNTDVVESSQTEDTNTAAEQVSVEPFKYEFVQFKYKSYNIKDIKPQIDKVADELVAKLKKLSSSDTVYIYGYADKKGPEEETGSKMGNIALSEKRAQALANYLTSEYNIPNSLFTVIGKGSSELKNSAKPYSSNNRRVVIAYKQ